MENSSRSQVPFESRDPQMNAFDYDKWRGGFILLILRLASALGIVLIIANFPTTPTGDRLLFLALYVFLVAVTVLRVSHVLRVFTLLFICFVVGLNGIFVWGPWQDGSIFLLTGVALAALLLDRRMDVLALVIGIVLTSAVAWLQQLGIHQLQGGGLPPTTSADWLGYIFNFTVVGIVLILAIQRFKGSFTHLIRDAQTALNMLANQRTLLEEQSRERAAELENRAAQMSTSSRIARTIAESRDIPELLQTAARLISEKLGYYHVGFFIFDEQKETAYLQSASSGKGRELIGMGFRVEPGAQNVFYLLTESKQPLLSFDSDGAAFLRDINFPLTRSRMILPLSVRGNILGALDIHSDQPRAFVVRDAETLQTLADLTAVAFDNVRLINETLSLVGQLETNTAAQTLQTWSKLTSRKRPAYQYTPAGVRPIFSPGRSGDGDAGLRVPLTLYGQQIGAIRLQRKGEFSQWSERERALVGRIADQVALAIENSRLVEEAQKDALRDQMIANISTRIRETLDIEAVVRTAATELRRVFDLKEAEIIVGTPLSESSPPQNA
jgi:GAF domain-containing protein